jgi:hypothetical protein
VDSMGRCNTRPKFTCKGLNKLKVVGQQLIQREHPPG